GPASAIVAASSEEAELESPEGLFTAVPAECAPSAAPARVGESGSNPCVGSCIQLPWDVAPLLPLIALFLGAVHHRTDKRQWHAVYPAYTDSCDELCRNLTPARGLRATA